MTWYVVRTKPQGERGATDELRKAGLRVYLPKRKVETRHRSRPPVMKARALFVGYVLVRFPPGLMINGQPRLDLVRGRQLRATWHVDPDTNECVPVAGGYLEHRFVDGLLTGSARDGRRIPLPLADDKVWDYMHRQRHRLYDGAAIERAAREERRRERRERLAPGRPVTLTDGAFAGFEGTIERVDGNLVWLLTEIFGRSVRMAVDEADVETRPLPVANRRHAA